MRDNDTLSELIEERVQLLKECAKREVETGETRERIAKQLLGFDEYLDVYSEGEELDAIEDDIELELEDDSDLPFDDTDFYTAEDLQSIEEIYEAKANADKAETAIDTDYVIFDELYDKSTDEEEQEEESDLDDSVENPDTSLWILDRQTRLLEINTQVVKCLKDLYGKVYLISAAKNEICDYVVGMALTQYDFCVPAIKDALKASLKEFQTMPTTEGYDKLCLLVAKVGGKELIWLDRAKEVAKGILEAKQANVEI